MISIERNFTFKWIILDIHESRVLSSLSLSFLSTKDFEIHLNPTENLLESIFLWYYLYRIPYSIIAKKNLIMTLGLLQCFPLHWVVRRSIQSHDQGKNLILIRCLLPSNGWTAIDLFLCRQSWSGKTRFIPFSPHLFDDVKKTNLVDLTILEPGEWIATKIITKSLIVDEWKHRPPLSAGGGS